MGAYYGLTCYSTSDQALMRAYSDVQPRLLDTGLNALQYRNGQWQLVKTLDGVETVVVAPIMQFAPCDPIESVVDGMALGFAIATVWGSVWAIKAIGRAIQWT